MSGRWCPERCLDSGTCKYVNAINRIWKRERLQKMRRREAELVAQAYVDYGPDDIEELVGQIENLLEKHQTYGYRMGYSDAGKD